MSTLIPAMVATAILGVVTVPIVNLSLETVKTRVDSELFSEAETLALGVRRQAAQSDSLAISKGSLVLTSNSVAETVTLPQGCSVATSANDPDFASVTCTASRGNRSQRNSQPLFAGDDFIASGTGDSSTVCYSRYKSQAASDNDEAEETKVISIDAFNAMIAQPGNSGGFLQLHTLSFPRCAQAAEATSTTPSPSPTPAPTPTPTPTPEPTPQTCEVPNYVGRDYNASSDSINWNDKGGRISASWSGKKKVKSQSPAAGANVACSDFLILSR
jgi:hypothetical protein